MTIIDGKKIAEEIQEEIRSKVSGFKERKPCLAAVLVGDHPASTIYVRRKIEACQKVGIQSIRVSLPPSISEKELFNEIEKLNKDPNVDGILVQLPLPEHINPFFVNERIDPKKDVDGFHPSNMGRLLMGEKGGFVPCTPLGVRELLIRSNVEISGKHVAIIGRSLIVGRPLAALLMQNNPESNATVTVLHSRSENLEKISASCDIVIVAIGKPLFLKQNMVKKGACVIDVGINRIDDPSKASKYKIVGDADFEALKNHCSYISPVPGGVGPMTIAMLLSNTLTSYIQVNS